MQINGDLQVNINNKIKKRVTNRDGTVYIALGGYRVDSYKYGLNLIRGYIGGGYLGSSVYSDIIRLAYATDAWSTAPNGLQRAQRYGGWASAMSNGYTFHNYDGSTANDRLNYPTEARVSIAARNYGPGGSPASCQEGVGYDTTTSQGLAFTNIYNTLASYGNRAFEVGKATTNWDALTFASETWQAKSGGPSGDYGCGWFDRYYSWMYASRAGQSTYRMTHSVETWATISTTSNPETQFGASYNQGAEKGLCTKEDKFYMAGNWSFDNSGQAGWTSAVANRILKFTNSTSTWSLASGSQTLHNNEHSCLMGMNHGYFAGGYNENSGQNAHTDKFIHPTESVTQISDGPRSLSSGSPMWSSY